MRPPFALNTCLLAWGAAQGVLYLKVGPPGGVQLKILGWGKFGGCGILRSKTTKLAAPNQAPGR